MKLFPQVNYSPDGGTGGGSAGDAGSDEGGDQGGAGGAETPGWISALPDEYKGNEYIKGFEKPGDFVKAHMDLKTEHDALKPKLDGAIFKPGKDATPEETAAYHKALGVPEKSDGYEFPKTEGVDQDDAMTAWARETFHKAGITAEQAPAMVKAWDELMQNTVKAQDEAEKQGIETAETALKEEWKADYDKNIEETKRGYQAFEKTVPGFAEFLAMDTKAGLTVGNHPMMLKAFHAIGKAVGDDMSIGSLPPGKPAQTEGFQSIYKVPNPPSN